MDIALKKDLRPRSLRVRSYPEKFNSYVRVIEQGRESTARSAQFADISATGMMLISRHPTKTRIGDVLNLEFTLPGSHTKFKQVGRVVRKVNEFVFAVSFIDARETQKKKLQQAIAHYAAFLRSGASFGMFYNTLAWVRAHRIGLRIALIGALVAAAVGAAILLTSDAFNGRELRAWGKPIPKQWFLDYYDKIPKPSK